MGADSTITTIPNISQLWDKSYVAISDIAANENTYFVSSTNKIEELILICCIIVFFIVAYNRIVDGLYYVFSSFYSLKKTLNIDLQNNTAICKNTLFYFLSVCVSFMGGNILETWSIKGNSYTTLVIFLMCSGFIFCYFLLKNISLKILGWVHKNNAFSTLYKLSITYTIINYTLLICGFIIYRAIESISPDILIKYSLACTFLSLITFYASAYKIFLANGFSHFFYILYLCTLEILPMVVIWDIIYA